MRVVRIPGRPRGGSVGALLVGRAPRLRVAEDSARIVLQRDGCIVIASTATPRLGPSGRLVLRRFTADGRPDATFPTRRIRTHAPLQGTIGLAIDRRDRITVAAAFTSTSSLDGGVLLARFLPGSSPRG